MASEEFLPIQGMSDLAYPEIALWQHIERTASRVFHLYAYREVRTPIVERKSVFDRALGDTTDIVQKEMYQFEDAGGRALVLRPEGTAGVIRYLAGLGPEAAHARVYYCGPMFRRERPQAGRKRQFHQIGAEALGAANPLADAEMIALQVHLLKEWGVRDFTIRINTRGVAEDRVRVQQALRELLQPKVSELCDDCRRRLETNVLRVLDCKNPKCRSIVAKLPPMTQFMSEEARGYFDDVIRILKQMDLAVTADPLLVRGLDYYQHTVWEIAHAGLGAQDALGAGGRYAITMAGREIHGVGFAMGQERLIMAITHDQASAHFAVPVTAWLISMDAALLDTHLQLAQALRLRGIACGLDLTGKSIKAQMRAADKAGAPWVILHGLQEQAKGIFILKEMASGDQREVNMPELLEVLKKAATTQSAIC